MTEEISRSILARSVTPMVSDLQVTIARVWADYILASICHIIVVLGGHLENYLKADEEGEVKLIKKHNLDDLERSIACNTFAMRSA